MGVSPGLSLSVPRLEKAFQSLQRQIHPDLFALKTAREQQIALGRSALANEAYHTLRDPLKRARYFLSVHGVDLEGVILEDASLLGEIMEEQEALEECRGDRGKIERKVGEYRQRVEQCLKEAERVVAEKGVGQEAAEQVMRAQYYDKLRKDALQME